LNRQGRKTATGERFTANQVGSLRRYRDIPRRQPPTEPPSGELVSIRKAAQILGMNTSSIHRWLADGFIAGEQVTSGAPCQIRITDELRARVDFGFWRPGVGSRSLAMRKLLAPPAVVEISPRPPV
jgi:hypothetical protein